MDFKVSGSNGLADRPGRDPLCFSYQQAKSLTANHPHLSSGGDGAVLGSRVPALPFQENDPVWIQVSAGLGSGPDQRFRSCGNRPGLGTHRLGHSEGEKAAGASSDGEDQVPGDARRS